jgi:preprotein translocase subunit SecE
VARDRKRAKQRRDKRPPGGPGDPVRKDGDEGLSPEPDALHRENVPGAWEHGGEVDQFEAAMVAGSGGEPVDDPDAVERAAVGDEEAAAVAATGRAPSPPQREGGPRFINFLRASWAELQRVQWPDRQQVGQATMVVLGFVVLAGAFLGFADFVAQQLVDLII